MFRIVVVFAMFMVACVASNTDGPTAGLLNVQHPVCEPDQRSANCHSHVCEEDPPGGCSIDDADCDGHEEGTTTGDNCIYTCNPDQANVDNDRLGDACDRCPLDFANDHDEDSVCGDVDNCPGAHNPTQANSDSDAHGDACDELPNIADPEASIAGLDSRLDTLEAADSAAAIAALQADVALLTAALVEFRTKCLDHSREPLGLNGDPMGMSVDPMGMSVDLSYSLPDGP
jgi:hypothetical protein